jgi:uncharacterized protein (DUF2342 family)
VARKGAESQETHTAAGGARLVEVADIRRILRMRKADDWTIERWRTEPRLVGLELSDATIDEATPLWKDLSLASAIAVLLWAAAAVVFG